MGPSDWLAPNFHWTKTGALVPRKTTMSLLRKFVAGLIGQCFFRVFVVESRWLHRTRNPCDRADPTSLIQHLEMRSLFHQLGCVSVEIRQRW